MYIPNHFREEDRDTLVAFMRANSFAILVTTLDGAPFATHLPLVIDASDDVLVLKGHVAKANPQWRSFANTKAPLTHPLPLGEGSEVEAALAIFHGPHAYVSPANYESKQSVPTWNYIAVHAYGMPRLVATEEAKTDMLEAMIAQYDSAYQDQWHELSDKYKDGMLNGIVAFEIEVTRLEGKAKLSQNRPEGDQQRVIESLSASEDLVVAGIAQAMAARRK